MLTIFVIIDFLLQICGCHEIDTVSINTVNLDLVIPFYHPPNTQPNFKHNSTSRKSFSRGNQTFRLSLGGSKPAKVEEELEDNKSQTYDEFSSPNLSLEVVNEGGTLEQIEMSAMPSIHQLPPQSIMEAGTYNNGKFTRVPGPDNLPYNLDTNYSLGMDMGSSSRLLNINGTTSLHVSGDYNIYSLEKSDSHHNVQDIEYNLNDSNPPILTNYDNYEMAEDFPVNQNLNYLTKNNKAVSPAIAAVAINATSKTIKKTTTNLHKRSTTISSTKQTSTGIFGNNKLGQTSSVSSMELHKLDDNMVLKKSSSSNVVNKNKRYMGSQNQFCKENTQQKNINVEIITKPPMRSRTTLDMRAKTQDKQTHVSYRYTHVLYSTF